MYLSKKIAVVIPARLNSSRFPKKILSTIQEKTLLEWVWRAAKNIKWIDEIIFAIDHEETKKAIEQFQGKYCFTSPDCQNGTERLLELHQRKIIDADIWISWQADEPFIKEEMIKDLLSPLASKNPPPILTLKKRLNDEKEIDSPHIVKVVTSQSGNALYFSRSPIPFYRNTECEKVYFKHIGLYAYSKEILGHLKSLSLSPLENAEMLEQLRFLEAGIAIGVTPTQNETIGIDLPEHLEEARSYAERTRFF